MEAQNLKYLDAQIHVIFAPSFLSWRIVNLIEFIILDQKIEKQQLNIGCFDQGSEYGMIS